MKQNIAMKNLMSTTLAAASALVLLTALAQAQPALPPAPTPPGGPGAETPPPPPPPAPKPEPKVTSADADVKRAVELLVGVKQSKAVGKYPELLMKAAVVNVEGLDNAVYFEISRLDTPWSSFRAGLITFYKRAETAGGPGTLVMRVLDFARYDTNFAPMLAGVWATPEQFPAVALDRLTVNSDIALTRSADGRDSSAGTLVGEAVDVPTLAAGAMHFRSSVSLGAAGDLGWTERGYSGAGQQVWGVADGERLAFTRAADAAALTPRVTRQPDGLVMIDYPAPADGAAALEGSDIAAHVTGWLQSDGRMIDNTRTREPLRTKLPSQLVIPGLNPAMTGLHVGQHRKVIIPAALGFGDRGRRNSNIPPNATLVYEIEALWTGPTATPAEPAPAANAPAAPGMAPGTGMRPNPATPPSGALPTTPPPAVPTNPPAAPH